MQKVFYEDAAYAVMWYDPIFSAWRSDRFAGYVPQPMPEGDPLEGWGGPSEVWWSIKPVGAGTGATETRGISAGLWIAIIAGVILIVAAIFLLRRRRPEEDEL
jgi:peptide/nickel transport system substrate-binding protein